MLLDALACHLTRSPEAPLPAALRARVLAAVECLAQGGNVDEALGFDRQRRNAALRRVAELVDLMGTDNRRASRVAELICKASKPGWRPMSEADHALVAARSHGPLPRTARRVYDAIREV